MLVQPTEVAPEAGKEKLAVDSSGTQRLRLFGGLAACAFWVLCNALVIWVLFGLPLFQNAPPLILLVAVVLANLYLIPLARRLADNWSSSARGRPGL
jgi:hypothetical protein